MDQIFQKYNISDAVKAYLVSGTPCSQEELDHHQYHQWHKLTLELYIAGAELNSLQRALKFQYNDHHDILCTSGNMVKKGLPFKQLFTLLDALSEEKDSLIELLPGLIAEITHRCTPEIVKGFYQEIIQFFTPENLERLIRYRKCIQSDNRAIKGFTILLNLGIKIPREVVAKQVLIYYNVPEPFKDYIINNTPLPEKISNDHFYDWQYMIPHLFTAKVDHQFIERALKIHKNSDDHDFNETLKNLISSGLPFHRLIELLELFPDSIMEELTGIMAYFHEERGQKNAVKDQFTRDIITFFTPEKVDALITRWSNHELDYRVIASLNYMQDKGIDISQGALMTLLQKSDPGEAVFLPLAAMIEDHNQLYSYLIALLPGYIKKLCSGPEEQEITAILEAVFNDQVDKITLKSFKKIAKVFHKDGPLIKSFFGNRLPAFETEGFHKMMKLTAILEPAKTFHYLIDQNSTPEQIALFFNPDALPNIVKISPKGLMAILPELLNTLPDQNEKILTAVALNLTGKKPVSDLIELLLSHPARKAVSDRLLQERKKGLKELGLSLR